MGESGQDVFPAHPVLFAVYARSPLDAESRMSFALFPGEDPAVMELVAVEPRADGEKGVFPVHVQNRIPVPLRAFSIPNVTGRAPTIG